MKCGDKWRGWTSRGGAPTKGDVTMYSLGESISMCWAPVPSGVAHGEVEEPEERTDSVDTEEGVDGVAERPSERWSAGMSEGVPKTPMGRDGTKR